VADASREPDPVATRPRRAWPWLVALLAAGGAGLYVAAPDVAALRAALARLRGVPVAALAIVIGGALGLVATEALRIGVVARLVGARVAARDAWDAAVANHVMTAVTPQVGLGEPTVAYTLARRGVPWDAAVCVPFVKFSTSLAFVFALGAGLVALGHGPPVAAWMTGAGIAWFGAIALVALAIIAVGSSPRLAARWIRGLERWARRRRLLAGARWQARLGRASEVAVTAVERLAVRRGAARAGALIALVAVHLVYYASYIAPLVGLALVLGDPPLGPLCLRAVVYLCFVLAVPTPGGAGPSEAAAAWFFGDLVAPADAIAIVVVFRASTFYLQLAIGALYLPLRSVTR